MNALSSPPPGATLGPDALIALRSVALAARDAPSLAALPGGFATRHKGAGLEVADLREYEPGDDLRHIDRGATARTGRVHVRQFQEDRDRVALLIADFRPSMFWGVTRAFRAVAAAEALALIGWNVVEAGGRVGLLAITAAGPVVAPPRPRARGMLDVIAGLVDGYAAGFDRLAAGDREDPALDVALARAERLAPPGAELFVASGFDAGGATLPDRLNALARRRSLSLVLVTAALAGRLPPGRYPIRLPDGRRLRIGVGGGGGDLPEQEEVAGRRAVVIDAGDPVETTATRLAAALSPDRAR